CANCVPGIVTAGGARKRDNRGANCAQLYLFPRVRCGHPTTGRRKSAGGKCRGRSEVGAPGSYPTRHVGNMRMDREKAGRDSLPMAVRTGCPSARQAWPTFPAVEQVLDEAQVCRRTEPEGAHVVAVPDG